ncbi:MAG: hypothetical protein GWP10_15860 [Nitrospiraceae bacterium]|nr:hypothetical protein [Nitrospiraceae bacterium]
MNQPSRHFTICVIEEYTTEDYFRIGKPLQGVEQDSKKLVKLRSIATFLGIAKPYIKPIDAEQVSSELEEKLEALDRVVSEKLKRKSDIDVKLKDVETTIHEIEPFFGINIDFDLCSGYDSLHVFSGTIKKGTDIETELKEITSEYQLFVSSTGVIILFIPVKYKDRVANLLTEYEFNEVKIPAISGIPDTLLRELKNQHDSLTEDIGLLSSEIDLIKVQYEDFILAGEELLSIETQKKEAPLFFATSDHTFAIDGWVPDDEFETVKSRIEAATDSRVHVTRLEEEIEDDADIPIEYENPKIVKPLEAVMDLYARPTYHEIDPTAIIFITFPLFYGLILGDVGYALILLGLSYYGRSKLHGEGWNSLFTLLIYCNIYTLFFGILYGEFLGFPLASHEGHSGSVVAHHRTVQRHRWGYRHLSDSSNAPCHYTTDSVHYHRRDTHQSRAYCRIRKCPE